MGIRQAIFLAGLRERSPIPVQDLPFRQSGGIPHHVSPSSKAVMLFGVVPAVKGAIKVRPKIRIARAAIHVICELRRYPVVPLLHTQLRRQRTTTMISSVTQSRVEGVFFGR